MDEYPNDISDAELDALAALLADESMWVEPDASLEERIVAGIEAQAATESSEPRPVGKAEASVADLDAHRRRRNRFVKLAPIVAVAALLAGALVVVTQVSDDDEPSREFVASLAGTELAPNASGVAGFVSRPSGVEIKVDLSGLPRAPEGSFYAAWVKGDAGLVPIGSFHTGEGDDIVLWSGVDVTKYPLMTVTIEPEDGDSASSGQVVLKGPIEQP